MSELGYLPPGIYIDENASPVPNVGQVIALPPSRVALVGPSIGYRTRNETIIVGADPVTLAEKGIDVSTLVATSPEGEVYNVDSDFTLNQTGSPTEEQLTAFERVELGDIPLESLVYVSYRFTDSAFYQPYFSTDWDEIQSRYGSALDATGAITSPLSLAAKIVMEQGAREIILVPTQGSTPDAVTAAQLQTAMNRLVAREDVGIVVPLPVGITGTDESPGETTTAATNLRVHVTNTSADGNYRIGIYGLDRNADRSHDALANAIGSKRVMLAFPNAMNWYNGYTNLVTEIDGFYLAAAYAGRMASAAPQFPLTKKSIASFGSIPARIHSTMTPSVKNSLSGAGVAVTEQLSDGRLSVRHGVTTDMTNVISREVSITRARDTLLRLVAIGLDRSGAIGEPFTLNSPVEIRGIVEGVLQQAVASGLIIGYLNLSVRSSTADPTILEVKFAYDPTYPLNRINVSFAINTQTGSVEAA